MRALLYLGALFLAKPMRQFISNLWSRIPRSYAIVFPIVSVICIAFVSWYEVTQVTADTPAETIMAILGRMDKVAAAVALFSVTILEGGSMVLAKILQEEAREEGLAEGIEIGRAESQERIAELEEQVKQLQSEKDNSEEEE